MSERQEKRVMWHPATKRLVTIAALVFLTFAPRASAGIYEVYACDPSHASGATPSWSGWHDPGFHVYGNCSGTPEGIVTRTLASPGATSSAFQGSFAAFDAPAGTTIDSIHGYFDLHRLGCNWGAGIKATGGDLTGRWVYALTPGYCGTDDIGPIYFDWPINDKRVVQVVVCGASTCDRSGDTRASMHSVRVTINDPTPPDLTSPRGQLWTSSGWLAGPQEIAFDASDGAGIKRNDVQIDDEPVRLVDHVCDDTQRAPCPNGGMSTTIDTSRIRPDGAHKLTLETIDTAGNPTRVTRTVNVDNTAPAAPTAMTVTGGDGWRSTNTFGVSWTNPASDGGAPITGAELRLCPAGDGPCVTDSRAGEGLSALEDVRVPNAGDWTLALWLRDAAGNTNASAAAEPVHLRFDDAAPDVTFEPPNASDPTLVAAHASDAVSGVANGRIEISRQGSNEWSTLASIYDGSRVTARLDDEHLPSGRYDLRAWAIDAAGNERSSTELAQGGKAAVRLPVRVVTRIKARLADRSKDRRTRSHRGRVRVPWGRRVKLGGQLLARDGNPISGGEMLVFERERRPGAPWTAAASLKTSRRGFFSYRAPAGPSRIVRFRFSGTATVRPSVRRIVLVVPARSTIHADRRRILNGEYAHLRGRVLGAGIPPGGKLVEIQAVVRGEWRTFATRRTNERGRWRFRYRFDGTHGLQTYRLRVAIPTESAFPYASGRSRSIILRVRGL